MTDDELRELPDDELRKALREPHQVKAMFNGDKIASWDCKCSDLRHQDERPWELTRCGTHLAYWRAFEDAPWGPRLMLFFRCSECDTRAKNVIGTSVKEAPVPECHPEGKWVAVWQTAS